MIVRQPAQNVPALRDTPDLPIHRDSELLLSFLPAFLIDLTRPQNPSKIRPKSVRFRIREFFSASISTTYNFNTVKWSDFSGVLSFSTVDEQCLGTESRDGRPIKSVRCYPFSLGLRTRQRLAAQHCQHSVRMRGRSVTLCSHTGGGNKIAHTVQNGTKRDAFGLFQKNNALYQVLATTPLELVPFSETGDLGETSPIEPRDAAKGAFVSIGVDSWFQFPEIPNSGFWILNSFVFVRSLTI